MERSKRLDAPRSSVSCSTQGSTSISLMIDSTISTAYPLCVIRQRIPWVTRPVSVIRPLPSSWLGLGGDSCFGFLSLAGMPGPFFSRRSSFPSLFRLDVPLVTSLGADEEAPSFSFFFLLVAAALTRALCLVASNFAKDKRRMFDKQTQIKTIGKRKEYNLRRREYACSLRAAGVGSGPP